MKSVWIAEIWNRYACEDRLGVYSSREKAESEITRRFGPHGFKKTNKPDTFANPYGEEITITETEVE